MLAKAVGMPVRVRVPDSFYSVVSGKLGPRRFLWIPLGVMTRTTGRRLVQQFQFSPLMELQLF